ncbi:hypothetical protein [Streptomyces sp. NPDC002265]|uniref:hypothetical protein n=1 Tax=Streptomyces sp. NPDC002265 TaxID=3154415 RepID=UPI0033252BCE
MVGTGIGATALIAAGITYAPAVGSTPASHSVRSTHSVRSVHRVARPVHRAAPVAAFSGGRSASKARNEGHEEGGSDYGRGEGGRIYFNERTYSASADGCITAASSSSFSIFNDSRQTVEVFRGFDCGGAPVTTVGPHGETSGTVTRTDLGGMFGDDGVVGSFRVIDDHDEW